MNLIDDIIMKLSDSIVNKIGFNIDNVALMGVKYSDKPIMYRIVKDIQIRYDFDLECVHSVKDAKDKSIILIAGILRSGEDELKLINRLHKTANSISLMCIINNKHDRYIPIGPHYAYKHFTNNSNSSDLERSLTNI